MPVLGYSVVILDTNTSNVLINTTVWENHYPLCNTDLNEGHIYEAKVAGLNELGLGKENSIVWMKNIGGLIVVVKWNENDTHYFLKDKSVFQSDVITSPVMESSSASEKITTAFTLINTTNTSFYISDTNQEDYIKTPSKKVTINIIG